MWVPLPETPDGSLALESLGKIRQYLDRATALVAGPGLGIEKESHSLVGRCVICLMAQFYWMLMP